MSRAWAIAIILAGAFIGWKAFGQSDESGSSSSSSGLTSTSADLLYLRLDGGFMNDTIKTSMTDGGILLNAQNTQIVASSVDGGTAVSVTNGTVALTMADAGVALSSTGQININVTDGLNAIVLDEEDFLVLGPNSTIRYQGGAIRYSTFGTNEFNSSVNVYGSIDATNGGLRAATAALPTCDSTTEGRMHRDSTGGATTTKRTKLCLCTRDSDDGTEYQWRNMLDGASAGTSTTCPDTP